MTISGTARRGFTLVEVLLSIVLGGLILTSAAGFLFGVFNLTLVAEQEPLFQEHVDASTRFLEHLFASAIPENDSEDENTTIISWQRIPGETALNAQALSFRIPGDYPIFRDEIMPHLPDITTYLIFRDREGLFLYWQTDAMKSENEDDLRATLISPNISKLTYLYYDADNNSWEDSDKFEQSLTGEDRLPEFIQLTYTHTDGRELTRRLILPSSDDQL